MAAATEPLLAVRDLSVAFHQAGRTTVAVDRISFDVKMGETVALVGESGSGKSVTALSVMKLLPYPSASHPSGSIKFEGQDLLQLSEREIRQVRGNRISIIFQEPMTSLNPLHTIEKQIGETLLLHQGLTGPAARARTLELLTQVGIPEPATRLASYPHQLSGGQRQRVMIAMALANEPDLLIADEPTTALDVTVQAQILTLLKDLQKRLGMAMLFITHDLGIVRRLADTVCVMKEGKIVEQGPVEGVFTAPQHPYTRALLAAEPKPDPAPLRPHEPMVVEAKDLKVWFPIKRGVLRKIVGHIKAVDGVDVAVRKGETLGIVGESGSGKTTLGLAILRLISSQGPIIFLGKTIAGLKFKEMLPIRHDMQIVFQDPYGSLSPRMSVSDIVEEGLWVHHPKLTEDERSAARRPCAARRRPRSGDAFSLSARVLRRAAPAHRARARDRAGADLRRARRADQRARHADPGADGRPAARPAEAAQSHLPVHLPRPARGRGAGQPADGDAPRQGGRGRSRRSSCSRTRSRDYTRALFAAAFNIETVAVPAWSRNRIVAAQ